MAMAPRSVSIVVVAPLLLLSVLVLVSTAGAARAVGGDTLQEACSKTQFPKICTESLAAKPESQKATPRRLAELFVAIAADKGANMAAFVQGKYNSGGNKDDKLFKCYDSCSDDVEEAVAHLNGLLREPTDAKFLELKSWLSSTLGGTSTCEDACKDAPKGGDRDAVVSYSIDFEKLQRITMDLINEASGSMSAGIALPPSEAGAPSYGAASAPSYGAASAGGSASADTPAGSGSDAGTGSSEDPAASGPSSGGGAKKYGASGASGPAADAPGAGASGPSGASAPSSSDSSGAPGPSSDGSSSAPVPSSAAGDDDDDDDDDGSS